jgi:hypothetical protein
MPWSFDSTAATFDSTLYTLDGLSPSGGGGGPTSGARAMAQYLFGPGQAWGTPISDASGNAIAVPSPILFAAAQDVSIDMGFETKLLHGTGQFPLAVGRGKGKVSGKIKNAQVNGALWNSIVFGQTLTNGIYNAVYDTAGALIPGTPFQVTPTVPSSGTWVSDLAVRNAAGAPMTRVASSPATGQYSVSAGVYTFAAADTGLRVFIDYLYTATSTAAKRSTVVNVAMGNAARPQHQLPGQGLARAAAELHRDQAQHRDEARRFRDA